MNHGNSLILLLDLDTNHHFPSINIQYYKNSTRATELNTDMPKTPSNKLFRLIKSLSSSERRYFKIFIQKKNEKGNKYLQLFEAIDSQTVFDDELLRKIIYGDQPIGSRKFSELKAYLYELILKSLQYYEESTSVDYKLKNLLQSVRVLFRRSHFDDCQDLLKKAKKLAYKYEYFNSLLEILDWEKKIGYAQNKIPFINEELERINEEEQAILGKISLIVVYQNLFFKTLFTIRKDASRREKTLQEIDTIFEDPLLRDLPNNAPRKVFVYYHRIHSIYHYSQQDYGTFYQINIKLIHFLEEVPYLLKEDISTYITILGNLILSCGYLQKHDEVTQYLLKIKGLKPITLENELEIHRYYYQAFFAHCIKSGQFDRALMDLKKHFDESKKFDSQQFQRSSFYFQYFYIYFGTGDFEKALAYLNEWLDLPKSIERQDLQSIARILNLIIHYEMGNTLLLESLIRSTYRFLKKGERLFLFEERMIGFIKATLKVLSTKELKQAFQTLKKDIKIIEKIPQEQFPIRLFNIEAWIESKIQGITFQEAVKQAFTASSSQKPTS